MTVVQIWNFFYSIFIPFMKYFWYTVVFSRSTREYIKKLTGCCIISLFTKRTLVSHNILKIFLYSIDQCVFLGSSQLQELQTLGDYLATLVWVLLYYSKPLFWEMSEGCWSPLLSCFFTFFLKRAAWLWCLTFFNEI